MVLFEVLMFGFGLLLPAGVATAFLRGLWKGKDGPKWYEERPPSGTRGYGVLWFYMRRRIAGSDTWARVNILIWATVMGLLLLCLGILGMLMGSRPFQWGVDASEAGMGQLAVFEISFVGGGLLFLLVGMKQLFRWRQVREEYLRLIQAVPPAKDPGFSIARFHLKMVQRNLAPWAMVSPAIGAIVMGCIFLVATLSILVTVIRSLQ